MTGGIEEVLGPLGFESHPFLVDWYNKQGEHTALVQTTLKKFMGGVRTWIQRMCAVPERGNVNVIRN